MIRLLSGDCRDVLPTLPADSVHCVVTSPPYYGLRDYQTGTWEGGDAACDHAFIISRHSGLAVAAERCDGNRRNASGPIFTKAPQQAWHTCGKCGARRIDRQIGLEATPDEYLATMVQVFREVRRVLRKDGTCWVNVGDSYSDGSTGANGRQRSGLGASGLKRNVLDEDQRLRCLVENKVARGVLPAAKHDAKPKDLLLMPARLALALQAPQHYGPITKETDRAWLAALIDGEGTISIARNVAAKSRGAEEYCQVGYTPFISIGNQDRELLDKCVAITGYGKVHIKDRPSVDPRGINSRRIYYGWRIDARMAIAVLRDVFPYLVAKRKQAVLAHTLDVSNLAGRGLRGNGPLPASEQAKREQLKVLCNAANQRQPVDMPAWAVEPPSNFEQGWWVRSDIIWAKPNPMPESCTDRCVSAHEHVFMLTKSARYFFDSVAIRENAIADNREVFRGAGSYVNHNSRDNATVTAASGKGHVDGAGTRSCRNVWTIATHAYPQAHFATFPPELAERCIRAGTSERGCCAACGKPWGRVTESATILGRPNSNSIRGSSPSSMRSLGAAQRGCVYRETTTTGWSPGCKCGTTTEHFGQFTPMDTVPCTVLDPFAGAGTTLLVADRLQRDAIGIDLSTAYTEMAMERCRADAPLLAEVEDAPVAEPPEDERMADLFSYAAD